MRRTTNVALQVEDILDRRNHLGGHKFGESQGKNARAGLTPLPQRKTGIKVMSPVTNDGRLRFCNQVSNDTIYQFRGIRSAQGANNCIRLSKHHPDAYAVQRIRELHVFGPVWALAFTQYANKAHRLFKMFFEPLTDAAIVQAVPRER